jgi:hypothetical protein
MKYTVSALIAIIWLMASCKDNTPQNNKSTATEKDSAIAQPSFFPVPDYIGGQLRIIDSLQLPLSMDVTVNGKTVSRKATTSDLQKWAQNFLHPNISDPALKKFYTETNIADQSIPSVTLIYSTPNDTLPVQKINVFIKPDPVQNDKVTGVYIEKIFKRKDTVFNQKLYWKTGKNMQVITEKKIKNTTLPVEQIKIIWNID